MRREFILLLMGIICITTLSSMLSGYVQVDPDKVLIDTVVGSVGAGNFSYWQLGHSGPLILELTSLTGDADLYVADNMRPSYETDRNNFSSVTCGVDLVTIPSKFPRPIGIGVFGHWAHSVSEYAINVFLSVSTNDGHQQPGAEESWRRVKERKDEGRDRQKGEDVNKPRLMRLLSLLEMIFDLIVL